MSHFSGRNYALAMRPFLEFCVCVKISVNALILLSNRLSMRWNSQSMGSLSTLKMNLDLFNWFNRGGNSSASRTPLLGAALEVESACISATTIPTLPLSDGDCMLNRSTLSEKLLVKGDILRSDYISKICVCFTTTCICSFKKTPTKARKSAKLSQHHDRAHIASEHKCCCSCHKEQEIAADNESLLQAVSEAADDHMRNVHKLSEFTESLSVADRFLTGELASGHELSTANAFLPHPTALLLFTLFIARSFYDIGETIKRGIERTHRFQMKLRMKLRLRRMGYYILSPTNSFRRPDISPPGDSMPLCCRDLNIAPDPAANTDLQKQNYYFQEYLWSQISPEVEFDAQFRKPPSRRRRLEREHNRIRHADKSYIFHGNGTFDFPIFTPDLASPPLESASLPRRVRDYENRLVARMPVKSKCGLSPLLTRSHHPIIKKNLEQKKYQGKRMRYSRLAGQTENFRATGVEIKTEQICEVGPDVSGMGEAVDAINVYLQKMDLSLIQK